MGDEDFFSWRELPWMDKELFRKTGRCSEWMDERFEESGQWGTLMLWVYEGGPFQKMPSGIVLVPKKHNV